MSDVNDLIDGKSKLKMSDGIVFQKVQLFFIEPFFFFFFLFHLVLNLHTPLPHKTFYIPLMMSILMITGVIVLMMMIVVEGDDTQALQHTISSLCSLNSVGQFVSCCASYNNGASITLASSPARECFISGLTSTTGSILTYLFVFSFLCSF